MKIETTYEQTLVHYPFAPMVLMVIAAVKLAQHWKSDTGVSSDGAMHTPMGVVP